VSGRDYVGGLVGYQQSGSITQSYATGAVRGSAYVGGLVGYRWAGSIADSFWDMETTEQDEAVGNIGSALGATGLTTAQARQASSYAGWDFDTVWYQERDLRPMLRAFAAPDRDGDGVYEISNLYQLQLMDAWRDRNYVLIRDIDASATDATLPGFDAAGIWSAQGFAPVGRTDQANSFQGSLDGQGHVISGLTIDRSGEDYAGLFGRTFDATIANVGLEGGSVTGRTFVGGLVGVQSGGSIAQSYATGAVAGLNAVGGLVGAQNGGSIAQSYATGAVEGTLDVGGLVGYQQSGSITQSYATGAVEGTHRVGGLVGLQGGGSIAQSYATGAVEGSNFVGGLVGLQDGGSIEQSYATGAVSGRDYVGGLVGRQLGGSITQSYATGAVSGRDYVGGLVGYQQSGSITQSYATGAVAGDWYIGGLVGYQWGGSIADSFWDRNTTQQDEAVGNIGSASGATGLTTAQMQDPFTFIDAGWDFAAIWGKSSLNENGGYMMLRGVGPGTLYDDYVRVAAVDLSRVYGSSNPALAPHVTIAGVGAANVSVGWGSAVGPQANAGAYAFTDPGVLDISTGSPGGVYVDYGSGTLTVTPRAITVTASNLSRLYGEANPALTFGPIGGDGLASFHADLAAAGFGLVTAAGMQSDVGSYAIDLTGANGNYDVTFTPGTLTVTPRAITVTADDLRKLLGQADPALTWSITGGSLASFDTEAGVFGGDLMRDPGEGVGTYSIRQGTLVANSNYDVTFVDGTLTIAPVAVSVASLFERALPLSLQADPTEGGALVLCDTGVLPEAECAAYPHPANRGLAHVGFAQ
ncbi:MBG-2 domain-containing protein, partial [Caldimonas thermodepolymerans]